MYNSEIAFYRHNIWKRKRKLKTWNFNGALFLGQQSISLKANTKASLEHLHWWTIICILKIIYGGARKHPAVLSIELWPLVLVWTERSFLKAYGRRIKALTLRRSLWVVKNFLCHHMFLSQSYNTWDYVNKLELFISHWTYNI